MSASEDSPQADELPPDGISLDHWKPYMERKSGSRAKMLISIVPGQTEDYVLPPNCKACPIPQCLAYKKVAEPHWRLNEHMKIRHGWPRKNVQPNTDRRLSRDASRIDGESHAGDESPSQPRSNSPGQDEPLDAPSKESKDASLTKKGTKRKYAPRTSGRRTKPTLRFADILDGDDTLDKLWDGIVAPEPQTNVVVSNSKRDDQMIAEIERYIVELQKKNDDKGFASGLQDVLKKDMIYVNAIMPKTQSASLSPLYKALADRASNRATVYTMAASPLPHRLSNGSRKSIGTPRGGTKITLPKMTPTKTSSPAVTEAKASELKASKPSPTARNLPRPVQS